MERRRENAGVTLVELICVIALLAVLITLAAPAGQKLMDDAQRRATVHDLLGFFAGARQEAVRRGKVMTLCPLDENNHCGKDWNGPLYLFEDPFNQRRLTDEGRLVGVLPGLRHGRIQVKSLSRSYFQYRPDGMIFSDLGNLTWCPPDNDPRAAAHLIISRGGRVRLAQDQDGDGIVEDADGQPVSCSA